jgi:SAM-dependent methyltransferase
MTNARLEDIRVHLMPGHGHTHDDHDWAARLVNLRRADAVDEDANREVARRLVARLPTHATVVDVGSGAGGMSAQFASALREAGGGTIVLVDAVPELLTAAAEQVRVTLGSDNKGVELRTVLADAADPTLPEQVPAADLLWASRVVHHLRDQQEGLRLLARLITPGGWFALAEGGLGTRCLPWDVGVGAPGLIDRLIDARTRWFAGMRAEMADAVRLTVGWTRALRDAGLVDVTSFSFLIDHPDPVSDSVRDAIVEWLEFHAEAAEDRLDEQDKAAVRRLLDPADPAYVGARDDLFYLSCNSVHLGRRPM